MEDPDLLNSPSGYYIYILTIAGDLTKVGIPAYVLLHTLWGEGG